jgi:very-short-patch-repair endonuclease
MPYEKSFESHEKSQYWSSKNGDITPRDVYKKSSKKYWFDCTVCEHSFNMQLIDVTNHDQWCSYCSNKKLCDDIVCNACFEKSFASHEKSQYWSSKNGHVTPREVFKSSNNKYWFDCTVCEHSFNTQLNSVTKGCWCSYCSNRKLCDDVGCNACFEKSFATNEKSQFWSSKNDHITPRQLFKSSDNKCWFDCTVCKHSFDMKLNSVMSGNWCSYCSNRKLCNDTGCNTCFERSFASHEKSQFWSSKNDDITPRQVFKSSNNKYWFDCTVCKHSFNTQLNNVMAGRWCSYCSNQKLCDNVDCNTCFEKSFASHEKNQYWSSKNNDITQREVFKSSNNKYWFDCTVCKHSFNTQLDYVITGKWCSYCSYPPKKLCDDVDCNTCFEKSFASHKKSQFWSSKNGDITPRQVFKSSGNKYWFDCTVCKHSFNIQLNSVMAGRWCSYCKNKTESKLFQSLLPLYSNIVKQFKQEWCKNIRYLPYDFCIPEHNIIIELDGRQHFQQVSNWQSPEQTYENDKFKEKCANDNNYSVIRLLQEDVWHDKNDWYKHLCDAIEYIKNGDEIVNICIGGKNGEYANY